MLEDDLTDPIRLSATNPSSTDLEPSVYEGGFKTWECSIDLAIHLRRLIDDGKLQTEGNMDIIEVSFPQSPFCSS